MLKCECPTFEESLVGRGDSQLTFEGSLASCPGFTIVNPGGGGGEDSQFRVHI